MSGNTGNGSGARPVAPAISPNGSVASGFDFPPAWLTIFNVVQCLAGQISARTPQECAAPAAAGFDALSAASR